MKHLKILGLAAVAAMALTAIFGATSASAVVFCKTNNLHCETGWRYKIKFTKHWQLTVGTEVGLKAVFSEVKCKKSSIQGEITNEGGSGKEVEEKLTSLTFEECKCGERTAHVTTTELGTVKYNEAGTVTSTNTKATIQCTGLASCIYGTVAAGTDIGTLTDSSETGGAAVLDASATLTWSSGTGDSGQFVCAGFGDTGTWTGSYAATGETTIIYRSPT